MTVTLDTINTAAADLIERDGSDARRGSGGGGDWMRLAGALQSCGARPGDLHLALGAYQALDRRAGRIDDGTRPAAGIAAWLRGNPVTGGLLAVTYGPQWEAVAALVRRAAVLTPRDGVAVAAARAAVPAETRDAGLHAAWQDGALSRRDDEWQSAWDAAYRAARGASAGGAWEPVPRDAKYRCWGAVAEAACALVVRDLLLATPGGTGHYGVATRPWALVTGPAHPGDARPV